ncbi:DUF7619 domain-containing protein [Pimelobacter simplex]|uniref:DUF7619 domain-containing protein n=1 Tax=Nocardioides simplex TaxID=2045 RepID=UPI0019332E2B|nr:hypothetical protein [Pimelobacter simplex]
MNLKGAQAYRIIVTGDPGGFPGDYEVGLYRIGEDTGCGTVGSTAWNAAARSLSFSTGEEIACDLVSATSGDRLRLSHRTSDSYLLHRVFNAAGGAVCSFTSSTSSQWSDNCVLSGNGPWRVLSFRNLYYSDHLAGTSASLWINNYATTEGCSAESLAAWGEEFPISDSRGTLSAECHIVTTGAAGQYLLRISQPGRNWTASASLVEVGTSNAVVSAGSNDSGGDGSQVNLKGAQAYRIIVTGDPGGFPGDYEVGLYRIGEDTGCGTVGSTAWNAAARSLSFSTGEEIACDLVSATSGDRLRLSHRTSDSYLLHRVFNAAGGAVCSFTSSTSSQWSDNCVLSGNGPWRVLSFRNLYYSDHLAGTSASLWINNYATTVGCTSEVDQTVALVSARISDARSAGTAADCHLSSLARTSGVRVDVVQSSSDHVSWEIVDSNGQTQCSGGGTQRGVNCTLTGPLPYRVLVEGVPGATYEIGVRRVNSPVGCHVASGIASGIAAVDGTFTHDLDQACVRFPGGAGDQLRLSAINPKIANANYAIEVYDPDGESLGRKQTYQLNRDYTLQQPGEHLAVIWLDNATPGQFRFAGECLNPACGPDELTVASVNPNRVGSSSEVTVEVRGKSLGRQTTVALVSGDNRIDGSVVEVADDSRSLTVRFDLSGRTGIWGMQVANPDGTTATLSSGVTVGAVKPAQVKAALVGQPAFVAGRPQTVSVVVENTGNVDGLGIPLAVSGLPPGSTIVPKFAISGLDADKQPIDVPFDHDRMVYNGDDGDQVGVPLFIPRLRAGSRVQYDFTVTAGQATDYDLTASVGACGFEPVSTAPSGPDPAAVAFTKCWDAFDAAVVDQLTGLIPFSGCAKVGWKMGTQLGELAMGTAQPYNWWDLGGVVLDSLDCAVDATGAGWVVKSSLKAIGAGYSVADATNTCVEGATEAMRSVASLDPNEIVGPTGGGDDRAIRGEGLQRYGVYFENSADASAPAQEVRIENQLDPTKYDLSTLRFAGVRFGAHTYTPPSDSKDLDHRFDLENADGLQVDITASVTPQGLVTWHLATVDPFTDTLPEDPFKGFLPPNDDGTEGQGVVFYDVALKSPVNATTISNSARIVFDLNDPIVTNTWSNLIDRDAPTAWATSPTTSTSATFGVSWTGSDATSGVASTDILVSVDGAPYQVWKSESSAGTASYPGAIGHTYAFTAVARDFAGNTSALPPVPHTTTSTTVGGSGGVDSAACTSAKAAAAAASSALADANTKLAKSKAKLKKLKKAKASPAKIKKAKTKVKKATAAVATAVGANAQAQAVVATACR